MSPYLSYTLPFVISKSFMGRYFETMWISSYPSNVHPLILASVDDSWLIQLLLCGRLPEGTFPDSIILSTLTNCLSTLRKSFPPLFPLLFYINVTHGFLLHPMSYGSLSLLILTLEWSQMWRVGILSNWFLCPFDVSTSFSEHFLPFWHKKVF